MPIAPRRAASGVRVHSRGRDRVRSGRRAQGRGRDAATAVRATPDAVTVGNPSNGTATAATLRFRPWIHLELSRPSGVDCGCVASAGLACGPARVHV
eukprot:2743242-Rhodomonas_salina.8